MRVSIVVKLFGAFASLIVIGVVILNLILDYSIPQSFNRHMGEMSSFGMMGMDNMMSSNSGIFGAFRAAVSEALFIAAIGASLAAILLSILLSRRMVRPVKEMVDASQSIAKGEYHRRILHNSNSFLYTVDEFDDLALNFNKMAEKMEKTEEFRGQLIGDISHELLTPLSVIKGNIEGLQDGVVEEKNEAYRTILREASRMQRLVNDLQELSKVEAGEYPLDKTDTPIGSLFSSLVESLGPQFQEKKVSMNVDVENREKKVFVDSLRIGQVITNMVGNALQYTESGGNVLVTAKIFDGQLQVDVNDSGIGLSSEQLEFVFDRFYRVDKSRSRTGGGSGIGLTLAKLFVEAHGGTIWAESSGMGKGSVFSFTIPVSAHVE